jgi:hypothetical protein
LRQFRRWLIDEKIEERIRLNSKMARAQAHVQTINSNTIWWIEKLLQTPIDDYRKFTVWRIMIPYLINIRRLARDEVVISRNIHAVKKDGYLPIGLFEDMLRKMDAKKYANISIEHVGFRLKTLTRKHSGEQHQRQKNKKEKK